MANKIKPKRSFSASSVPSGLESGELAVNVTDQKIYIGDQNGTGNVLIASMDAADLSGTLQITNGGTGQTTANDSFNALAPSQTGNGGKYLTTDGSDTSWATVSASPAGSNQDLQFNNNGAFGEVSNWDYDNSQYTMNVGHQSYYTALKIQGLSNVASNIVEIGTTTANVFSIYNTLNSFGAVTINKLLYLNGQGELRLNDADNSNYIALRSPATVSSNVTWTLPSTAGSNGNVLSTDGSGNLSWSASGTTIPAGSMQMFAGSSAPSGWLFCDGSSVSRTTYATLFSAIGTTYGAGNGSTTFNLPDCRGRTLIGVGQGSGLTNRTLGATTGTENHTLSLAEIPSHNHGGITGTMNSNTTHSHNVATRAASTGGSFYRLYDRFGDQSNVIATESTNTDHTHNISSAGSGSSHNNMQPSLAVNFIIKT